MGTVFDMAGVDKSKIESKVSFLEKEVSILRGGLISILGKDKEGSYQDKFVRSVKRTASDQPTHSFKDSKSFLAKVRK